MNNSKQHRRWIIAVCRRVAGAALALAIVLVLAVVTGSAQAQTFSVLYSFMGMPDGEYPSGGLVQDAQGNLYGTTYMAGAYTYGTVFKLDTTGKESVLYSFTGSGGDGQYPYAGLVRDAKGNLYGTTRYGGASNYGTVFKLDTAGKETVLHSFTGTGGDGEYPETGLVRDAKGNLYGTAYLGGAYGQGMVFKVDKKGKETVLYSFTGTGGDGAQPWAGLVRDTLGNLYGTTLAGGAYTVGTVFKLDTTGKETVLYSFAGRGDGAVPYAGLVRDAKGNLYGTTFYGGASNSGTVFKLDTTGQETVLYTFTGAAGDGMGPYAGLVRDGKGNLYGTTAGGGAYGEGTVFKVDKKGKEIVLYSFDFSNSGGNPIAGLIRDAKGNLYGTAAGGGPYYCGTVFKLTPQ